jgi:hypothetical protein
MRLILRKAVGEYKREGEGGGVARSGEWNGTDERLLLKFTIYVI